MASTLSYLTSLLPTLPSLPLPSLPHNIQRRLLSFLLRRSLGKFVTGGLDADAIEADLARGNVSVQRLEFASEAITPLLEGLPIKFEEGSIGSVSAQVSWPLSLSSTFSVDVEDISLVLRLESRQSLADSISTLSESVTSRDPSEISNEERDASTSLADSLISIAVASEFVKEELDPVEDAALRESLHLGDSSIGELPVPGAFGYDAARPSLSRRQSEEDDAAEVTVLANLIDRILSRLSIRVGKITLRLVMAGEEPEDEETIVELVIDSVVYATDPAEAQTTVNLSTPRRIISIASPTIRIRMPAPTRPGPGLRRSSSDSSASTNSSTTSSEDEDSTALDDLAMSQSVADLRTSFVSARSGVESMYASARSSRAAKPEVSNSRVYEEPQSPFVDPDKEDAVSEQEDRFEHWQTVVSFGFDPLHVELGTSSSNINEDGSTRPRRAPELSIKADINGPLTVLLLPPQLKELLRVFDVLATSPVAPGLPKSNAPAGRKASPPFSIATSLKTVNIVFAYDVAATPTPEDLAVFWAHPSTASLSMNALRLRLDGIDALCTRSRGEQSVIKSSVRSLTITETTQLGGELRTLPVIVGDPNLDKQYELTGSAAGQLPTFDSADWLLDRAMEGRGWRVKPRAKVRTGGLRSTSPTGLGPACPSISVSLQGSNTSIELSPHQVFVDVGLVERLLPLVVMLAEFAGTDHAVTSRRLRKSSDATTPHALSPRPATPLSPRRILDDLSSEPKPTESEASALHVSCPMLRIALRCPPPRPAAGYDTDSMPSAVRSAIMVLDLHDVAVRRPKVHSAEEETMRLSWNRALLATLPPSVSRCTAFACITSLQTDKEQEERARPAHIAFSDVPETDLSASHSTIRSPTSRLKRTGKSIDILIPLLRVSLSKQSVDALQFFADDLAQWSQQVQQRSTGSESRQFHSPDNKMIGSRFFGAKTYTRSHGVGSDSSDSGGGEGSSAVTVTLAVTDSVLDLIVPRIDDVQAPARQLRIETADILVSADVLHEAKNDLRLEASIGDVAIRDMSAQTPLLSRTLSRSLTRTSPAILRVAYTSAVDEETRLKESRVEVTLSDFTFFGSADLSWVQDLGAFAKAPEGAFEAVVPNELTRLRLHIIDGSIHLVAPKVATQLVLCLEAVHVSSNIIPDMPRSTGDVELGNVHLLAVDGSDDLMDDAAIVRSAREHWKSRGFVDLVSLRRASIELRQGNGLILPDLELFVRHSLLELSLCADSLASVSEFCHDFMASEAFKINSGAKSNDSPPTRTPKPKNPTDLLESIDSAAFEHAPALDDNLESLDDDVPTNLAYLSDALQTPVASNYEPAVLEADRSGQVISDIDGETIRILDPKGLVIMDDYFAIPHLEHIVTFQPASVTRCKVSDCDVIIHLHEGYDWQRTRKMIEAEAKRVRKRLEKIRQLLAAGQTPDASAEDASVLVFGSVQLGLPPGSSELPPPQLLAAIDEELKDHGEDAESTSSWRSSNPRDTSEDSTARESKVPSQPRRRRQLHRSRGSAIDINLRGLAAAFDTFPTTSEVSTKVKVEVQSFDLLDNIKSSTWKKFLTELRPTEGGVVRASGEAMARVDLTQIRSGKKSTPSTSSEDINLKVKIFPLRLYIDQDALDFLKAFGAFQAAPQVERQNASATKSEPFFRRVEIMPVKIKLDYKPKRVDYQALRRGKTAELMNFFHFDGSEMTLRHLVVRGVSGTTRLSELVQDIWTPDVKANQLADVISGIGPVRSVVNVGSGVANLVLLPIEQFRKDGRVVRGLQKGAATFARQTTLEALNVGARLATGTQVILEQAEAVLGGRFATPVTAEALAATRDGDSPDQLGEDTAELISRYAEQPSDLRDGVESAYKSLGDNFRSAAQTILAVPMEVYERSGQEGPVRSVVRAVPVAVLKPMIGASEAVSKALFGLRNSLDPDAQEATSDKYKQASGSGSKF